MSHTNLVCEGKNPCQFQDIYSNIVQKHYPNFQDDFFDFSKKKYCIFHAPMEAKKIGGDGAGLTKKEISPPRELVSPLSAYQFPELFLKFYNVIYGVINQQIYEFVNYDSKSDEIKKDSDIDFSCAVFPREFSLKKDKIIYRGEEYKKYSECEDTRIPFLYLSFCEFYNGIELKSLVMHGASFDHSIFNRGVKFVNIKSPKRTFQFDGAKFYRSLDFRESEFFSISFNNALIDGFSTIDFRGILIHGSMNLSCDQDVSEEVKKIKSRYGIFADGAKFGDSKTYKNYIRRNCDIGGELICKNRIFDCDVNFDGATFYQAPDFSYTRFDRIISFSKIKIKPSCYKGWNYNLFAFLRIEMERKHLYREEIMFWRMEQKCLQNTSLQSPIEKSLSSLFELICKRGTSFEGILISFAVLTFLIFPGIYFVSGFKSSFKESFDASLLYTFDPFHKPNEKKEVLEKISLPLFMSYTQSIVQFALYVIFGFMLRRRFRMKN